MDDLGWKLASAGALAVAAFGANKLTEAGWKLVTGKKIPKEGDDEAALVSIVLFSAASAAIVAVAQHYAMKRAKKWYGPGSAPGIEA
ncbi:DUF4235 domain-containing protein [Actinomyces sp. B33]|uniref:DUF4235 domain-containing protein n=1 Tax=Actinomyces sp. B33 TaxID=2942131 RepID=UPI002340E68E|nr:DUF4235 domain-containing protein [Actinomyces sp. B33]MDC4232293.1 DUF4235 domain-containing protein [Actinomyces sp. B33]